MAEFNRVFVPELTPVVSSTVSAIGYDSPDLYVQFRNGSVYMYKSVPETVFNDFLAAESKGRFFALNIRGKYNYDYLR